jgi:serine/threonine-protein kinase RsbW
MFSRAISLKLKFVLAFLIVVTQTIAHLSLASELQSIAAATDKAVEIARNLGYGDDAIFGIDMAVREAVTNAVIHGNREDASVEFDLTMTHDAQGLTIAVRDRGNGFDPAQVADPTAAENLMATNGRGILFMRNFMDDVTWETHSQGGTVVRLTKRK